MANVDRVTGFTPVGHLTAGSYSGQSREFSVASSYATNLFVGDPVKESGTSDSEGVAGVEKSLAGNNVVGVVTGVKVDSPYGEKAHPGYIKASTGGRVSVSVDPFTIYEAQADGVTALVDVGQFVDHTNGAGDASNGNSGVEVDSSTKGATNGQWKILGFAQRVGNEPGVANAKVLITLNEGAFTSGGTAA